MIDVRDEAACSIHHTVDDDLSSQQLGDYISDIASNMMLVEEHLLWMAQNEARACTRIVQCVERIADLALSGDNQAISKVWPRTWTRSWSHSVKKEVKSQVASFFFCRNYIGRNYVCTGRVSIFE